jgi:pseudaminic acid biosynthesis-associated methylase
MNYQTEQEEFWSTDFGDEYPNRNIGEVNITSNIAMFINIMKNCDNVDSIAELGCNIGLNLIALNRINKNLKLRGYEINEKAANHARQENIAEIFNTTVIEPLDTIVKYDLTFTKGVLIHINPNMLPSVYQNLYNLSNKYILICEYYNPTPVTIDYRGNKDRLFKRDFAGEFLEFYPDVKLIDYEFCYRKDKNFPQDDVTWFLMEKKI